VINADNCLIPLNKTDVITVPLVLNGFVNPAVPDSIYNDVKAQHTVTIVMEAFVVRIVYLDVNNATERSATGV
jgi:hypothetical protein